jgi:uncharacterized membrane protein
MKRPVLDSAARDYALSEAAIDAALELTGARPHAAAWRSFTARLATGAGIAALGSGAIFFVAANWQALHVLGRFAMVQAALLACIAAAWWRPPPERIGRAGAIVAIFATGALLALFGETYQTGADLFELFFAWAGLALPFALAAQAGAAWAIWWIVLDVALALYCGWLGPGHFLWAWLDRGGIGKPAMLLVPAAANLAGAALFFHVGRTRFAPHAPRWLVRLLAAIGFGYGTAASMLAVLEDRGTRGAMQTQDMAVVLAFATLSIATAMATLRAKRDVFPMTLVIGSWIIVSTTMLVRSVRFEDAGGLFLVAAWIIATSTASGFLLMRWVKAWNLEDDEAPEASA